MNASVPGSVYCVNRYLTWVRHIHTYDFLVLILCLHHASFIPNSQLNDVLFTPISVKKRLTAIKSPSSRFLSLLVIVPYFYCSLSTCSLWFRLSPVSRYIVRHAAGYASFSCSAFHSHSYYPCTHSTGRSSAISGIGSKSASGKNQRNRLHATGQADSCADTRVLP